MKYQAPRGTQDFLPEQTEKIQRILEVSKNILEYYGFREISTPLFESTELFLRSVGESSDIVNKEMYTFLDKSERSITLRPELTAGLLRAYLENSLHREPKPVKLWTFGPAFRYERPQVGRFRQFYQLDAEVLGDNSTFLEAESIFLLNRLLTDLKIDFKLEINSLGDEESRKSYKEYFYNYTKEHLSNVCDDCKKRFEQNPLRMLDCKVRADQEIYNNAKKPLDFLSESSKLKWEEIKELIGFNNSKENRAIKEILINPNLVRGLDYYNDFVFEIKANSDVLKEQSTICGGGRYNKLVESLGGPDTPGFGWAMGLERLLLIVDLPKIQQISIQFISSDKNLGEISSNLYKKLHKNKVKIKINSSYNPGNVTKQIESAIKRNIDFIVFRLEEEIKTNKIQIRDLKTHQQESISINSTDDLSEVLGNYIIEKANKKT